MSRITGLKNKINRLESKITDMEGTFTFKCIATKDKEIELLKLKDMCNKEDIANLVDGLRRTSRKLKNAHESIVTLNTNIKISEDKKIKNKLKKLFTS